MHALQPKHIKLKKEEAEKVLKKYNISSSQLPKISKKDSAIASIENIQVGNIIKIERKKEGEEYFRVVI